MSTPTKRRGFSLLKYTVDVKLKGKKIFFSMGNR